MFVNPTGCTLTMHADRQTQWSYETDVQSNTDKWTAITTIPTLIRNYDRRTASSTTRVTYDIPTDDIYGRQQGKRKNRKTALTYTALAFDGENSSNTTTIKVIDENNSNIKHNDQKNDHNSSDDEAKSEPEDLETKYSITRKVAITATPGYYIDSINCPSGVVCTGEDGGPIATGPNVVGDIVILVTYIKEEGITEDIVVTTRPIEYPISVASDNSNDPDSLTISVDHLAVPYLGSRLVTIDPAPGYYLSAINAPTGYTYTTYEKDVGLAPSSIPVQTGEDATGPQTIVITNNRTTNGGTLTFAVKPRKFTVEVTGLDDDLNANVSSLRVAYGHSKTILIAPSKGHYLKNLSCPEGYTCAKVDGSAIEVGEDATSPQNIVVTNDRTLSGGTLSLSSEISQYTVNISHSHTNSDLPELTIPYGGSREIAISPDLGYYLGATSCPTGYTCAKTDGSDIDTSETAIDPQTIMITNNNYVGGGIASYTGVARDFELTVENSNVEVTGADIGETAMTITVPYGGSKTIAVTPSIGYYLSVMNCPTGYTCLKEDGTEIDTGKNAISTQNITLTNDGTIGGGTLTLTGTKRNFSVSIATENVTTASSSILMPYNGSNTITVSPDTGYYLSSFSCSLGYTCTKEDGSAIDTSENAISAQTIKITNDSTPEDGNVAFIGGIKSYEVAITPRTGASTSTNSLKIPYGGSRTFTITPNAGYYLTEVTCSSGYVCSGYSTGSAANPSAVSRGAQTITVKNNSYTGTGSVSFTLGNTYNVSISAPSTLTSSPSSVAVPYGGSKTVTITPSIGYYVSSASCPSGYTCSGYSTAVNGYFSAQTVTIENNSSVNTGTLSFTMNDPCAPKYGTDVALRLADGRCWARNGVGTVAWNRISTVSCPSGMSKPGAEIVAPLLRAYGAVYNSSFGASYGSIANNDTVYKNTGWNGYFWTTTSRDGLNAWNWHVGSDSSWLASGGTKSYQMPIICYGSV